MCHWSYVSDNILQIICSVLYCMFTCLSLYRGVAGIVITHVCVCVSVCLQDNSRVHWWMLTKLGSNGQMVSLEL